MTKNAECMEKLARAGTRSRADAIQEICTELQIPYRTSVWQLSDKDPIMTNVYLHGESDLWLMAHHDVIVPESHNANDNAASVLNAILCKKILPWLNVALTDGEECPYFGAGSRAFSREFQDIRVINLELTGVGGSRRMAVNKGNTPLAKFLAERIPCLAAPFNDACVLERAGIDSACIFTCTDGTDFDPQLLRRDHTMDDSLEHISFSDMEDFREKLIEMLREMKGEDRESDIPSQTS